MIIDHVGVPVQYTDSSKKFFSRALAPLGITVIMEEGGRVGMGKNGKPEFWFGKGDYSHNPMHIAFVAQSMQEVNEFYEAALAAGGKDNGSPGFRNYTPGYYAAFVKDDNGHNVEAVYYNG